MRDLLVDLSNACRDDRLGGKETADWHRLDLLIGVWKRDINPDTDFYFVADNNLARYFRNKGDRDRWQQLTASDTLKSVEHADTEILRLAFETGASVLSCDKFDAHRRQFPWVNDDQQHFWEWSANPQQGVVIRRRSMGHLPAADLTRAEEKSTLKALGLSDEDPLLNRLWRCCKPGCKYSDRQAVTRVPAKSQDRAICPLCHTPLIDLGERPRARRLKLVNAESRLVDTKGLADGQNVTVGRGEGVNVWDVSLAGPCDGVSRKHARLDVRAGQVVVTDLGSTNGTWVANWNPAVRTWLEPVKVECATTLRARDRIELPNGLWIEQSGARYVVPEFL